MVDHFFDDVLGLKTTIDPFLHGSKANQKGITLTESFLPSFDSIKKCSIINPG